MIELSGHMREEVEEAIQNIEAVTKLASNNFPASTVIKMSVSGGKSSASIEISENVMETICAIVRDSVVF